MWRDNDHTRGSIFALHSLMQATSETASFEVNALFAVQPNCSFQAWRQSVASFYLKELAFGNSW